MNFSSLNVSRNLYTVGKGISSELARFEAVAVCGFRHIASTISMIRLGDVRFDFAVMMLHSTAPPIPNPLCRGINIGRCGDRPHGGCAGTRSSRGPILRHEPRGANAEPGKIVPPLEISPSISRGDLPAAYNYLAYDQGRIPAAVLFSAVPFGMEPWEYAAWWFEGEGASLAEDIYHRHNIQPLLCSTIGPETAGWYRKPIESLDDLKGLKIRFSGLGGMVLNEIGASATLMAGGEIFAALEKGTLDATEYSMPAIDEVLGFHKIAKFNLFPGWHQVSTSTHLLINLDEWNKLSAADQTLFEMACTAATMRAITTGEALQGAQIMGFKDKGVTAAKLPDDVIQELKRVAAKVMEQEAAKDADFKRVWESQQAFHAQYQVWKEWGYLPRDFQ